MADLDMTDAPSPTTSKRRRTSALSNQIATTNLRFGSPDELTTETKISDSSRRTSIRRSPAKRESIARPRSSDDELNNTYDSSSSNSDTDEESRSRSRSPSTSASRKHLRSRQKNQQQRRRRRARSVSDSRSPSSDRSRPRRRSRSPTHTGSRSRSRSDSRSTERSRPRYRETTRSRSRSRSHSPSHSRSPSPRSNRSSQSLTENVERRLRLSVEAPPTPPRKIIRPNYEPCMTLSGHKKAVSQVRLSPDGRWIASASADATVKIWDAATGHHMDTLVGHMAGISCVAWSPDSRTLATGSDDKAIRLWDRVTGRPKLSAKTVLGAKGGAAQPMPPLLGHHNYVVSLAFSPKGNILASGSYDEAVFLWDVRAGRLMRSLPAHSDPVSGIGFCLDGTLVVSCSTDGLIRIWDTYTGQCLRTLVHEDNPAVTSVCFAPNGRYVLACNLDNSIRLWDYVSGTVKKTYQGHENEKFAVGGCFGLLAFEDAATATVNGGRAAAGEENEDENGVTKSGRRELGAFIACASEDGDVVMWDVTTKEVIQRISPHPGKVCFWVDVLGDAMVTAGQDGTIVVYKHRSLAKEVVAPALAVAENGEETAVDRLGTTPGLNGVDAPAVSGAEGLQLAKEGGVDIAATQIKMEDEMDVDVA